MTFLHKTSNSCFLPSKLNNNNNQNCVTIIKFHPNINIFWNKELKEIIFEGPLGKIKVFVGNHIKTINNNEITFENLIPQTIAILKHLNRGLIVGYSKRIFHSGVWTIMKKPSLNTRLFQLGYSHPTIFNIPNSVLFHSKRDGQFRTINLFSISYQDLTDTAAKLVRLKPADPYKLSGFRYDQRKYIIKEGKK